jgi:hypothetical protein
LRRRGVATTSSGVMSRLLRPAPILQRRHLPFTTSRAVEIHTAKLRLSRTEAFHGYAAHG